MEATSPVLPSNPQLKEIVFAKDQPEYKPLPGVMLAYQDGQISIVTSYRLTWIERLNVLLRGRVWFEVITGGGSIQPQHPHAFEPMSREKLQPAKTGE